jgi:hypothetical protein
MKPLVGHHLMRVRIRRGIFEKLEQVAEEESIRTNEHVTVSDLVRAAVYNYLLLHESVRKLESFAETFEGGEIFIVTDPML